MKKRILLLFTIFIMGTTSVLAEVFVKALSLIKEVEIEGKGKAGKWNVPALRQMEWLDTAKKSSQKEIGNYINEERAKRRTDAAILEDIRTYLNEGISNTAEIDNPLYKK